MVHQHSEKRKKPRIIYWIPIAIEESGIPFIYRARLANYSKSGIYFETDLLVYPGAKVYIGIQNSTHRFFSTDHGSFLVEIIWRKRLSKKSFNYGYGAKMTFDHAEYESPINQYAKPKELRKNPRKPFSKPTYFISADIYYQGAIKNISRRGAFIETKAKLSNGDELKFVVLGPKKYALLKGEIIHSNLAGFGVKFKSLLKVEKLPRVKNIAGN